MNETLEHRLLIGCRDWEPHAWEESFYPDDLPPEWRLSYYANQFRVVLVPAERLFSPDADPEHWCTESDEGFRFICETPLGLDTRAAARAFLDRIAPFGGRCIGIRFLVSADLLNRVAELDVILAEWVRYYPVSVDLRSAPSEAVDRLLRAHDCSLCWHGPPQAPAPNRGHLALTVLEAPLADLRALREVVEACLSASTLECTAAFIVDAQPSNVATAEQAGTVADLL